MVYEFAVVSGVAPHERVRRRKPEVAAAIVVAATAIAADSANCTEVGGDRRGERRRG
ncbi:hypothetical protein [Mobiluncus mulieris]|uniref:hypothetical protein n=1 Tax=Mobiluncus mulieris TaxID=2052 RepID=UPI0002E53B60|nr:hypothetical protein [Mobiluncus mulieris]NMW81390.1 hypothetical protein [Mobiluncus mulieris]STY83701.1 Uncharacterised protein [Mobiluncus mulieris]